MAQIYGPHIVTDGLVLAWNASDVNSYPAPIIVGVRAYSVYDGGLRSANYTVQFSDDNSTWTTAFTGIMSNNSSCGIITGTGVGSGTYGRHRYWRYVEGSAVVLHHPRVSRIDLIDINGTIRNLVTYTSDNCSDSGTYIVGTVSADLGGTLIYDLSGNGNNGTLYNGVGFSTANGGVLTFDGTNDYVSCGTPNLSSTDFTVIGAARYSGGTRGRMINATSNNWLLGHWSSSVANYYAEGWVTGAGVGGSDTNWRIYTGTGAVTADSYNFYINGTLNTGPSNAGSAGPNGITIGTLGSEWSTGEFSFVYVYNRVLSVSEIVQMYNAKKSTFSLV